MSVFAVDSVESIAALLPLFVGLPLLAAGILVIFHKVQWLQETLNYLILSSALAASAGILALTADGTVMAHRVGNWDGLVAIPFAADTFTALMLVTVSILALLCSWFATASGFSREPFYAPLTLVLMSGVYGALLTADIFNFFVFIEVMLVPSYGLYAITIYRRGGDLMVDGMRLFITSNMLASTMLLAGVGLVYGTAGAVNLAQLESAAAQDPAVAIAMSVAMLAMLVKASVVPVHSWLARTYPYTSPAVTALFSGLHTKVAVYALYRWYAVVFDGDARWLWILVLLFTVTMVVGVFGAVGEKTTREILTFHMVSQLGYILMGVALFTELGMMAGIFYLVHHMIVKASLFMSTGAIEVAYGTGELGKATNMAKREPLIAVAFFAAALSLAGIPPLSGFVAKFTLMLGTFEAGEIYALVAMVVVSLVTLLSMLKIWAGMFWGDAKRKAPAPRAGQDPNGPFATLGGGVARYPGALAAPRTETAPAPLRARVGQTATAEKPRPEPTTQSSAYPDSRRVSWWLAIPAVASAALSLTIGLGAEFLLDWSRTAALGLLDTSSYVEAVLG